MDPESIKPQLQKSVDFLKDRLKQIRTGRAEASLVEHIKVNVYGTKLPLNQVATISVPEPKTILITPWDKNNIEAIVKALQESEIGVNPSVSENSIRLILPPLTEERRHELVKVVKEEVEAVRISIRNIRKKWMKEYEEEVKKQNISKEEKERVEKQIDDIVHTFNEQVEKIGKEKEMEIITF